MGRSSYLNEELSELQRAIADEDRVGVADALADLIYFATGTAIDLGIDLDYAFEEVHRSNMTKTPDAAAGKLCTKGQFYDHPHLVGMV